MKSYRKFLKNKIAVLGAIVIIGILLISIFGYFIAPDNSINANQQHISIRLKPPGFQVKLLHINNVKSKNKISNYFFGKLLTENIIVIDSFHQSDSDIFLKKYNQSFWTVYPQNDNDKILLEDKVYYLGTDGLGRDVLSRLIIGARISILVGIIAVLISLLVGIVAGVLSGYYGGWIDKFILWLINVFWAIPTVLLALALLMSFQGDNQYQIFIVFLAVGLTMWVDTARIIRGLFMQLRERQFVEAARALSYSDFRIVWKHIFPNTFSTLLVVTGSNFATAILMESGLSYLGLGVQPPTPSWGAMLREYYVYLGTDVSYLALFPGLCIMFAVFSFYVFGNGLRDALDVKV